MGAGKVTAGLDWQGLGSESTTLPSPCPSPTLAHHGQGTSGRLAGPPSGVARQDAGWLQGQPQAAKQVQHPRPPKGWPRASKGMGVQGQVVRVGGVANLPPPPVARLPQLRVAGLAQPPRRVCSKPSTWPCISGPAASLTTAKVAASCPLHARSASCSSRWRCHAIASSISRGGASTVHMPSPGPSRWRAPPASPPGRLGLRATWAPRAQPPPAWAPTQAPPCHLTRASSPPPHPPPPAAAIPPSSACSLKQPLQRLLQALDIQEPSGSPRPSSTGSAFVTHLPGHQLPCVPMPPQGPTVGAQPGPPHHVSCMAQRQGQWGGGLPRLGGSRSPRPPVGLWAGKEGRLARE